MKRIAIIVVMVLLSLGASARSIHYFTYSQASRTVNYLNSQRELMIYCGYDYEIETYVLISDVWMERVNSAYYEIWIYGFDAYTGDEIYMPLDLQCVWLYSGGRYYNAAQYLRFRVEVRVPSIRWHIPAYNHFTRIPHRHGYVRTYHYDIHRHGWMPPAYTYGPGMPPPPLPYYYMRPPSAPAPMPQGTWTPGNGRPTIPAPSIGSSTATNPNAGSREHNTSSSRNMTSSPSSGASTAPASGSSSRSSNASPSTPSRSSSSSTSTATRSGNTATGTATRSGNNNSTTPTRSSSTSTTPTRSNTGAATGSNTRSSSATTTPTNTSRSGSGTTTATRSGSSTATRNANNSSKDNSNKDNTTSSRNSSSSRNSTSTRTR